MRRFDTLTLLLVLAVTLCSAGNASAAAGVALRWSNCFSDGGLSNKSFACNQNIGTEQLIGTFQLATAASPVFGFQTRLIVATSGPSLPAWWGFLNAGSCRQTAAALGSAQPGASVVCQDAWSGQAAAGIGIYAVGVLGPSTARISGVGAVPGTVPSSLSAGIEYFCFHINISHAKSVGTGSCAGCSTPACIMIEDIQVMGAGSTTVALLTTPSNGSDSHFVTWQGGAGVQALPNGGCAGAVPVRNRSWTGVKSLYR